MTNMNFERKLRLVQIYCYTIWSGVTEFHRNEIYRGRGRDKPT